MRVVKWNVTVCLVIQSGIEFNHWHTQINLLTGNRMLCMKTPTEDQRELNCEVPLVPAFQ